MNDWIVPLLVGGPAAFVAWHLIGVQLKNRACRRRDRELQVESARLGLSYKAEGLAVVDTLTPFVLLDRNDKTTVREARNLMQGEKRGVSVAVFDFEEAHHGNRKATKYDLTSTENTVVVLEDRVLSFFEANPGWIVEGSGPRLLIYRSPEFHPRKDWSFGASPGYVPAESVEQFLAAALDVKAVFA